MTDENLKKAIQIYRETGRTSQIYLMRRMQVTSAEAQRLVDYLKKQDITEKFNELLYMC